MTDDFQDPVQTVEAQPTVQPLRPHRGGTILALGIIGIVCCWICGIIAWVMGNGDLRAMDAGMMDPSGRGLTQAGRICGIISVVLAILGIVIWLLLVMAGVLSEM